MTFEGHEMTFTLKIKNADEVVLKEYTIGNLSSDGGKN